MKKMSTVLWLSAFSMNAYAHDAGHTTQGAAKIWSLNNQTAVDGAFLAMNSQKVYLESGNGQVSAIDISEFQAADQLVFRKYQRAIDARNGAIVPQTIENIEKTEIDYQLWFSMLVLMGMLGFITVLSEKKNLLWAKILLSTSMLFVVYACKTNEKDTSSDTGTTDTGTDTDTDTDTNETGDTDNSDPLANDPDELMALFWLFEGVVTEFDEEWFYIGSDGLPAHNMMVGITNWQQQVPIDQDFSGDNRWQIPLQPVIAEEPLAVEGQLFRNAIGIAVNGVPLFHPITASGVDSYASGQLDQWGGHSGRADDYHYHLPPAHLQATAGENKPIAFALDGFPIYGETTEELDENLGRVAEDGSYRYHTIPDYPYFMAGLKGEVDYTETQEGQDIVYEIIPQPRTQGARPSTTPLGGTLEITNFVQNGEGDYSLTYVNNNETYIINYSWDGSGAYTYEFIAPDGSATTETYQRPQ